MQGGIAQQGTLQVLVVVVVVGGLLCGGTGTGGPKLNSPSRLKLGLVRTWGGVENSNERDGGGEWALCTRSYSAYVVSLWRDDPQC